MLNNYSSLIRDVSFRSLIMWLQVLNIPYANWVTWGKFPNPSDFKYFYL